MATKKNARHKARSTKKTTKRASSRKKIKTSTKVTKQNKRKSTIKKVTKKQNKKSSKKATIKRTSPKNKPIKKKTTVKKATKTHKKTTAKRKITPKKTTKKVTTRKKATTQIKQTPTITKPSLEEKTINKLITEIRSLEQNNFQLAQQLEKAQTKREIISELKVYLSNLKDNSQQTTYNPSKQIVEETNKQLEQAQERVNNKDKLINRLKSLIARRQEDEQEQEKSLILENEIDSVPSIENIKHIYPGSVDQKLEHSESIEVEVEESTPEKKEVEKNNDKTEVTEVKEESKSESAKAPSISAKELVEQKVAEIEENSEKKKDQYQTTKKRGIISPEEAQEYSAKLKEMEHEINKVFIGQETAVKGVLISVLCSAHSLLEGVPGLAKTLLIETLGLVIDGTTFKRIQFLPDLLPSDIIGGQVFNPKTAEYTIYKGPIFANFVLADEINRAPPKTHAAIMEAMQEKKINIESETFILDKPFFVLATQNPLENKGTYELPEAVLDRFMFKVILDYPERKYELAIITENATTKNLKKNVKKVVTKEEILKMQEKVRKVYLSDKIREYIMDLVEATRGVNKNIEGIKFVKYGAGVRASIYLCLAAQANAVFEGRNYVLPDDVDAIAQSVLRHRVVINYRGKAHNISPEKIVEEILSKVKAL